MGRPRGRFIVFEGGEGSGKSTQAARLAATLGAVLTREPGGTPTGEAIRSLTLDAGGERLDVRTEALLMAAARAQHVATVIAPNLEAGTDVVCDRFSGSSIAYQGYGRGLPVDEVAALSRWAATGVEPDVVILLVIADDEAARRRAQRARCSGAAPDRMETEDDDFHRRVRHGFAALAQADAATWRVVDGTGHADDVAGRILAVVEEVPAR